MDYVLTTEGLSKAYNHFKALHNLSMHVPKGSFDPVDLRTATADGRGISAVRMQKQ